MHLNKHLHLNKLPVAKAARSVQLLQTGYEGVHID